MDARLLIRNSYDLTVADWSWTAYGKKLHLPGRERNGRPHSICGRMLTDYADASPVFIPGPMPCLICVKGSI